MKNQNYLKVREEELMNFLWDIGRPLTVNEMVEHLQNEGWNSVTLFKTVRTLTESGYLEVKGVEKSGRTYIRKLAPALSKEEYYSSVMMKRGINSDSIADITAAFLGISNIEKNEKDTQVIEKLQEIINQLKNKNE